MRFVDLLSVSISATLRHKLRSFLTLIGIVIGITSYAAITSVVRGIDLYVQRIFAQLGSDNIIVNRVGIVTSPDEFLEGLSRRPLAPEISEMIKQECQSVSYVSPVLQTTASVKAWRGASDVSISGVSEDIQYFSSGGLEDGRFFSAYEVNHARNVCVIGWKLLKNLFQTDDVVGKEIYIKGHRFIVIGVQRKTGGKSEGENDQSILIPYTTFERIFGGEHEMLIVAKSADPRTMDDAIDEIRNVVRRARRLKDDEKDDFGLLTAASLRTSWKNITSTTFLATIAVGGIALFVGGIGVMNIMLVSVKERTMEIGLRKATGATRRDVLFQFLVESVLLCLAGGAVGIALGLSGTAIILKKMGLELQAVGQGVMIGFGTAFVVGVFFGVYPAYRAAGLEPNEALRYEQ
ncbi:MAG: ABC transporter permease [bacterium]